MDAPDNFTLDRWLCRRCQWAIFTSLGRRDGILSVTFVCGYPDEALQREAAETGGNRPQCAQFRPRHEWPLAREAQVYVHCDPDELTAEED
jgi:hypothetical protein